jgi:hypothetical protein
MQKEKPIPVRKIKKAKIEGFHLRASYEEVSDDGTREIAYKSAIEAHPDLLMAFAKLQPAARIILCVPDDWARNDIKITGVSWSCSEATGVRGAVITGQATLPTAQSPFNFNTMHLPFEQYCEDGNAPLMPDEGVDALDALEREVLAALDGKSAQGDLAL